MVKQVLVSLLVALANEFLVYNLQILLTPKNLLKLVLKGINGAIDRIIK
jgi:hypothetical protein